MGLPTGPLGSHFNFLKFFPNLRVICLFGFLVPFLFATEESFGFDVDPRLMLSRASNFRWYISFNNIFYFFFDEVPNFNNIRFRVIEINFFF